MKDVETGQRGFVITGEVHYLEPYSAGFADVELAFADIRKLTSDNASQQRRLDVIEPLIRLKLDALNQTIALRRDVGFEERPGNSANRCRKAHHGRIAYCDS